MFERFTDHARKVMALANLEAQRFNHECVGTEHVLLGMVKESTGVGVNVLKNLDVDPRRVRLEVEKVIKSGPDLVTMGKLPVTSWTKIVIDLAGEESRFLNHNYVGTEHLLLGLLRDKGIAGTVLCSLGLTLEEVRAEVLSLLEGDKQSAPPAPATREQMIEAAAKAMYEGKHCGNRHWEAVEDNNRYPWRCDAEAALLAVGAIQPLPKPAPVEAVKTETPEEMAARYVSNDTTGENRFYVGKIGLRFGTQADRDVVGATLAYIIRQALAARDAAHNAAMNALRAQAAGIATRRGCWDTAHEILALSITPVEAP